MRPFLKWAGGKRWLFDTRQFSLPPFNGRYIEPFLGGGAVFFQYLPKSAILGDKNARLIELYQAVRDNVDALENLIRQHALRHSKAYYYATRSVRFEDAVERAAQFLYLNRTCWNGLYRENLKGEFNVPIGTKQQVVLGSDDFGAWSRALRGVRVANMDFEETIEQAGDGDFIFADPPYTVRHNMNGFVKYNQDIFAWEDQVRLRDALRRASQRGALFALTNADHDSVRELYADFGMKRQLSRFSVIAARAAHRAQSTELLITG